MSHAFSFEGGEYLTVMGATWFVSYCYYNHINKAHKNWNLVKTSSSRASVYGRTKNYHKFWLTEILKMDDSKLNSNTICLNASETKRMAKELLKYCSENNDIWAQIKLGDMYLDGIGVEKDLNKAAECYEKTASQDCETARKKLLRLYYLMGNNYYSSKDYVKAFEYYKKSSELNNFDAQIKLGDLYCSGIGVEKNFSKAAEWYEKASGLNSAIAHKKLFDMYYQMGEDYYKEHNFEKAKEYYEKAAENDNAHAQIKLGDMYLGGDGVEQDYEKACKWFEKAAEQGNHFAKKKLLSIKSRLKKD